VDELDYRRELVMVGATVTAGARGEDEKDGP
jgi:hypothetical protein